jgi:hypothetical protein
MQAADRRRFAEATPSLPSPTRGEGTKGGIHG